MQKLCRQRQPRALDRRQAAEVLLPLMKSCARALFTEGSIMHAGLSMSCQGAHGSTSAIRRWWGRAGMMTMCGTCYRAHARMAARTSR